MAITDPIADMFTRIRNAGTAKHVNVDIPNSKVKTALAKVLLDEGYIKSFKVIQDSKQGILRISLKYGADGRNAIYGLNRVSKPSRRFYVKSRDIQPVLNGMGVSIISTSKGIMTDKKARDNNLGGEILCNIW